MNPFGLNFALATVDDLVLVGPSGEVIIGSRPANSAAFAIHASIHAARPDVVAAAHAHSVNGKAWSALGQLLDPITQDSCAFFEDHAFIRLLAELSLTQQRASGSLQRSASVKRSSCRITAC